MNSFSAPHHTSSFSKGAPAPVIGSQVKRFGIVKMRIGANFMIRGKDGRKAQFEVRERARFKSAPAVFVCLHAECKGKTFKTADDVIAQHPEHEVMERSEETHIVGMWSDSLCLSESPFTVLDDKGLEKLKASGMDVESATMLVGLLSDER